MATKTGKKVGPITIENAKLIYRNFEGRAKKFNAKGLRNFHVVLDDSIAARLENDGWNVRWHDPKDETDKPWASLKVAVRFDPYPPRILLITKKGQSTLEEDSVDILDWAEINIADLVISASPWEVSGKKGIKAYLQKAFITLSEDDLETKYHQASVAARRSDDEDDD
jgi:hypothetical protein